MSKKKYSDEIRSKAVQYYIDNIEPKDIVVRLRKEYPKECKNLKQSNVSYWIDAEERHRALSKTQVVSNADKEFSQKVSEGVIDYSSFFRYGVSELLEIIQSYKAYLNEYPLTPSTIESTGRIYDRIIKTIAELRTMFKDHWQLGNSDLVRDANNLIAEYVNSVRQAIAQNDLLTSEQANNLNRRIDEVIKDAFM